MFPIFLILTLTIRISWTTEALKPCNFSTVEEVISCKGLQTEEEMISTILKEIAEQSTNTTTVSTLFISHSTFGRFTFEKLNLTDLVRLSIDHTHIHTIELKAFENFKLLETLQLEFGEIAAIRYGAFLGLPALKVLKISKTLYLQELPPNIFSELFKLETLDLSGNSLDSIDRQDFGPLIELQNLNMSGNQIKVITPKTFAELGKLKVLDLSANFILKLRNGSFTGLDNLTALFLNANEIRNIDPSVFRNMKYLEILNLANNKIINLHGAVANLKNLSVLTLGSNSHLELNRDTFKYLRKLTDLDLSFCELKFLPRRIFHPLVKLDRLNLRNNQLGSHLDALLLRKLKTIPNIDLSGNRQLPSYGGDYSVEALEIL